MHSIISEDREKIGSVCHHRVRRLSIFGPAVRDGCDAGRDADLLVEFEPLGEMEHAPNYFSHSESVSAAVEHG